VRQQSLRSVSLTDQSSHVVNGLKQQRALAAIYRFP